MNKEKLIVAVIGMALVALMWPARTGAELGRIGFGSVGTELRHYSSRNVGDGRARPTLFTRFFPKVRPPRAVPRTGRYSRGGRSRSAIEEQGAVPRSVMVGRRVMADSSGRRVEGDSLKRRTRRIDLLEYELRHRHDSSVVKKDSTAMGRDTTLTSVQTPSSNNDTKSKSDGALLPAWLAKLILILILILVISAFVLYKCRKYVKFLFPAFYEKLVRISKISLKVLLVLFLISWLYAEIFPNSIFEKVVLSFLDR